MKANKKIAIIMVFALLLSIVASIITVMTTNSAHAEEIQAFTDISNGNDYYIPTKYLKEHGIINGYEDGTFKPSQEINRVEALKMLVIASSQENQIQKKEEDTNSNNTLSENLDSSHSITEKETEEVKKEVKESEKTDEKIFTDTENNAWYTPYLKEAKEKGIIKGYEDGSFKPEQNVNLVEALKIYIESLGIKQFPKSENFTFVDTNENEWYSKYIALAGEKELLEIYPSGKIYPNQEITRGYLADIIYKMIKSKDEYKFGKATFYGKALQGHHTASGEIFDFNLMTAAHKTLPLGTFVEVTNLANGKSIKVKVNDRGPYGAGRVLDLSSGAFEKIASLGTGIINIEYKIVNE